MRLGAGENVTRLRPQTSIDRYSGEHRPDWTMPPSSVTTSGWGVDDSRSTEPLQDGRTEVVTDFVLYCHKAADVLPGDRVIVRGFTCEVVGRPATWNNPMTGRKAGFVVRANLVEG